MSEPALEPQPVEPAAVEPAEPGEPAWSPSQDDWQQLQGAVGYLAQLEQQRAQVYLPAQNQGEVPLPDPWERPDSYQDDLKRWGQSLVAPVREYQTQAQYAEAEERLHDMLSDFATRDGEFDVDLARIRVDRLFPQMQQRYGNGAKAAEAAAEAAAAEQRAYEQKLYEKSVAKYTNQLSTLSGAPGEPGSSYTQGVQQRTMPDYRQGGSVTNRFFNGGDRS